jgi:CheY-like chemotaxis protein
MTPILIVDDSREDIALVTRVLWQCRIRNSVVPIVSGQECIAYFERADARAKGSLPCLVLLDLTMTPKSGIDVLRYLTTSSVAAWSDSVFVMLSGVSDYSIVREGYQLGATTFLTKPLECDELMAMLKSVRRLALQPHTDGFEVVIVLQTKDHTLRSANLVQGG